MSNSSAIAQSNDVPAPILRWAGSKKRSLPTLQAHRPPEFKKYIEPFAGSAALFFALRPKRAILGDINPHVMDFYEHASAYPNEVYRRFKRIPRSGSAYYLTRQKYASEQHPDRRSAYFFYLNRNCFNGIFRVNKSGVFNVPFSESRVAPYPSLEQFKLSLAAISSARLLRHDFSKVCRGNVRQSDFVYLDPPYYVPSQRVFQEYGPCHFGEADLSRLDLLLDEIHRRKAFFLLSFPDCEFTKRLRQRWNSHLTLVHRTVSGTVSRRGYSPEVLIFNYQPTACR